MPDAHLDPELLTLIAEGELPSSTLIRVVVSHLRSMCPDCGAAFQEIERLLRSRQRHRKDLASQSWSAVYLLGADPNLVLQRAYTVADRELRYLRQLTPPDRLRKVARARTRFRTPAQVERFLAEGRSALRDDPRIALGWIDLAREVVPWLHSNGYPAEVVDTLALRAQAHRANALRVTGDLRKADTLFKALRKDPRRNSVAVLEVHAELASLEASLRQDQRRFDEADELLHRAAQLSRAAGDVEGFAQNFIQRGIVCDLRGKPTAALPLYRQAADALEPDRQPLLYLMTQHSIALCLCLLAKFQEAEALLARNRALYERCTDPEVQVMRTWLEARIARGLGDSERAERLLLEVRAQLLNQGRHYSAALAAIDLAEIYLAGGRTAEVKQVAQALAEVFGAKDVHPEAARALALFREAALAERLTLELLGRFRRYLEAARGNPRVRFRADG